VCDENDTCSKILCKITKAKGFRNPKNQSQDPDWTKNFIQFFSFIELGPKIPLEIKNGTNTRNKDLPVSYEL
jgi:hypothetical protein